MNYLALEKCLEMKLFILFVIQNEKRFHRKMLKYTNYSFFSIVSTTL